MGAATALGQGAIVLAAPVLVRLYDPQAFGLFSVYVATLSVMVAIASLRFDLAIPVATDSKEAVHLLGLSLFLALATSVALGLIVAVWGPQFAVALGAATLSQFLWLLPIAVFVASVAQALSSWAVYNRSFPDLARMRATQGLTQAACQVALGLIHAGPVGLILGDVGGRIVGMERLLRRLFVALRSSAFSFGMMGRFARERWAFARAMTLASLLSALSLHIPFLLIPTLFDLESSGQFFLAHRTLMLPASLVAAAVNQVFFGEASFRRADPRGLHDLAYSAAIALLVFSIPTYAIVAVGGSLLFEAAFGDQWMLAGLYAQIMAPSLILRSVASPISSLVVVGRRERESIVFAAAELALRAASVAIGALLHSLTIGVVILSAVSVLLYVAALWRFLRVATVRLGELVRPAIRITALTTPFLALVVFVSLVVPGGVPLAAALGWLAAFGLAARFSPEVRALLSGSHD